MKKLTSAMIKARAKEIGLDDIGIAPIERYKDAPPTMNPANYFPGAKSVIVTVQRITRGSYRGIEEGTHWNNYTFYSYNRLNTYFRPRLTYAIASFVEDHGWEAVPHYPGVPERNPNREPVTPGRLPPDVVPSVRFLAAGAGVGEIGWSKVFLHPKFGPRVRLGSIFTDAELEPDDMIEPGTICNRCGACARKCPGAIPAVNSGQTITINIGGKDIVYGDVDMGKCTFTHHGLNNRVSPFLKKDFPNLEFDVASSNATEEEAYKLCYALAGANWSRTPFNPDGKAINQYPFTTRMAGGYFALCGARGCIRACMDSLEKSGRIEQTFETPFYRKPSWDLDYRREKPVGKVNPWWEDYLTKQGLDRNINKGPNYNIHEYKQRAGEE
ncbi:MAG: hypothetical protein ACOX58_08535 [Christensenellales bacterium]|jgi:epoxyqueuosine reductase